MGERKQDVYYFKKMYKQIILVSLSLLLSAFPSYSVSPVQIMAKHGLIFIFCKSEAVLVCSFVNEDKDKLTFTKIKSGHL